MDGHTACIHPECRMALKEWAVVEQALLEGRQSILLRKGGLIDGPSGFRVDHPAFYIYPTFHHQQRDGVKRGFEFLLKRLSLDAPPRDEVTLTLYAKVRKALRIDREEELQRLNAIHILNSDEVRRRFHYGKKRGISVLYLDLFRLREPVRLPVLPRYIGCRSWVDLGRSLKVGAADYIEVSESVGDPSPDPS